MLHARFHWVLGVFGASSNDPTDSGADGLWLGRGSVDRADLTLCQSFKSLDVYPAIE